MTKYVVDTNVLLNNPEVLEREGIVIPSIVLQEIESLERKKDFTQLQFQVRIAKRAIREALDAGRSVIEMNTEADRYSDYDSGYADNSILSFTLRNGYEIITNDLLLQFKAEAEGLAVHSGKGDDEETYEGYKVIELGEHDTSTLLFQNLDCNTFGLHKNQYLIIEHPDVGVVHTVFEWTGDYHVEIPLKSLKSNTVGLGEFKAKDVYQNLAIHSIRNNQVTMLRGRPGTGKTLIGLTEAWNLVENEGYKLNIFFNPAPARDATEIGFLPGDLMAKAMGSSLGSMLKSKFGGESGVLSHIESGDIELHPFVDLRGFDTSGEKPSCVYISEAQNLTTELLKMGLQRVDEDSIVIIDGDFEQQVDKEVYARNNGMRRASEVLRGSHLYGEVKLVNVYRSELADIVDKM